MRELSLLAKVGMLNGELVSFDWYNEKRHRDIEPDEVYIKISRYRGLNYCLDIEVDWFKADLKELDREDIYFPNSNEINYKKLKKYIKNAIEFEYKI